ncbi:hypothetical protein DENSPDRAFT_89929 [Dentipellis sp. KUC8613]|nr:hypothetical protein DENSPDRAFT_89929 [Dentipellis sp. KUC8613]
METVVHLPWSIDPPVHRLPVEILRMIFHLLLPRRVPLRDQILRADIHSESRSLSDAPRTPCPWQSTREAPSWTAILFVCRHWHAVAKNYPALWTRLTRNPAWTKECIRRSRQMPLELTIELTKTNLHSAQRALHMAISHFHRIANANIVAQRHDFIVSVLERLKGTPAPRLEAVSLVCRHCESLLIPRESWLEHPEMLFAQQTPRLRLLYLGKCRLQISPSAPLFRSLTHLDIRHPGLWKRMPMADFVACAAAWTNLESLVLEAALPNDAALTGARSPYPLHTPERARRLAFPHLRQIRILSETATAADQFLRYCALPPLVSLFLCCTLYDVPADDSSWGPQDVSPAAVALSLLENVPRAALRRIDNVGLALRGDALELTGLAKGLVYCQRDETDGPWEAQLGVVLRETDYSFGSDDEEDLQGMRDAGLPEYVFPVLAHLDLAHATEADVAVDRALPKETWVRVLGTMGKLEDLRVQGMENGSMLCGVLEALAGDEPPESNSDVDIGGSRRSRVLLPRLRCLRFNAADMGAVMWQHLVVALRRRRTAGSRLRTLAVTVWEGVKGTYRPDELTLKELNELVEEGVTWPFVEFINRSCGSGDEEEEEEGEREDGEEGEEDTDSEKEDL